MELTTSSFAFVKELADFSYKLSALDRVWNILFPVQRDRWNYLHVNKYKHTFYITHVNRDVDGLEVEPNKCVRAMDPMGASSPHGAENHGQWVKTWGSLITYARKWLKVARKDWIKANKRINVEYPLHYRYGIAPNALVRASLPDIYRLGQGWLVNLNDDLNSLMHKNYINYKKSFRIMYWETPRIHFKPKNLLEDD